MIHMEEKLTPSYHGEKCRHNGSNPDFEIACDECDYSGICMPDWKYLAEHHAQDHSWESIQTSASETLQAFLQASAASRHISETEKEIALLVMQELRSRNRVSSQLLNAAE